MCTLDYIESLSKINRNIQKMFLQKLKLIGNESLVNEFKASFPEAEGQSKDTSSEVEASLSDIFRQTLLVIHTYSSVNWDFMHNVFLSLKLLSIDYPDFNRIKMDGDTKQIYLSVKEKIEKAPERYKEKVLNELIACKNAIFKLEN